MCVQKNYPPAHSASEFSISKKGGSQAGIMHSNNLLLKSKTPPQLYTSLQLLSAINVGLNRLTALQPQELLTLLFRLKQIQRIAAPATATVFLP